MNLISELLYFILPKCIADYFFPEPGSYRDRQKKVKSAGFVLWNFFYDNWYVKKDGSFHSGLVGKLGELISSGEYLDLDSDRVRRGEVRKEFIDLVLSFNSLDCKTREKYKVVETAIGDMVNNLY